jgi:hypothetical protein
MQLHPQIVCFLTSPPSTSAHLVQWKMLPKWSLTLHILFTCSTFLSGGCWPTRPFTDTRNSSLDTYLFLGVRLIIPIISVCHRSLTYIPPARDLSPDRSDYESAANAICLRIFGKEKKVKMKPICPTGVKGDCHFHFCHWNGVLFRRKRDDSGHKRTRKIETRQTVTFTEKIDRSSFVQLVNQLRPAEGRSR